MKNFLVGLLLFTTVAFAGLYWHENEESRKVESEVADLKKNNVDLQAQLDQQQAKTASLRQRASDMRAEAVIPATPVAVEPVVAAAETNVPSASTNSMKSALAGMLKSPEMREMIKNQQKAMFATMIDKNYKTLFGSLNLTPDQAASMKDLLTKKMMVDADTGMQMMGGDLSADDKTALIQKDKDDKAELDQEMQNLLGADGFSQYQAYDKTMPERMVLDPFADQMASGTDALSPAQQQQLLQAMVDERSAFKFTTDYSDKSKIDVDMADALSEDRINQYFTETDELEQQYLSRAKTILSADQMAAYQKFLANQAEMQKAGMKMAASMFAPKK